MSVLAPAPPSQTAPARSFFERTGPALALLFVLALPIFAWNLGAYGLIDVDEGRYAEVAREMLATGDWITPRLNFLPFFDKPPLLYWGTALAYQIGGTNEAMARAIPMLAALVGVGAAYGLGRRLFGARAGFLGAVILTTSLMWAILARVVLTDMLVSSLCFCGLAAWWLAISDENARRRISYGAAFWASLGLGILAKGPVAVVVCGGSIFVYLLLCKRWRILGKMGWSWGLPLLFLVAAPWFVWVALRNPEFNHDFWYAQNFARFLGSGVQRDHAHGPLYLLPFLPLIVLPWSFFAPAALFANWRKLRPARTGAARGAVFLLGAIGFVTLFFSASESKLVTYILPIVPLYAVLLGGAFDRFLDAPCGRSAWWGSAALLALILVCGGIAAFARGVPALRELNVSLSLGLLAASAITAWGSALMFAMWKRKASTVFAATAGGFALCFAVAMTIVPPIVRDITTQPLIAQIRPGLQSDTEILAVGFSQSLPFYTGKRMRVWGTPDELAPAKARLSAAERALWFFEMPDLRALMLTPAPVYCVVRLNNFQEEQVAYALRGTDEIKEVARNKRFLILANAAAARLTPPRAGQTHFDQVLRAQGRPGVLAPTPVFAGGLPGENR